MLFSDRWGARVNNVALGVVRGHQQLVVLRHPYRVGR